MRESDWSDPEELRRTWQAALVRVPVASGVLRGSIADLDTAQIPDGTKFPTVIYLHGCAGVWAGTYRRIDWLAENGFAVIAPVSFAREKYPQSCDPREHRSSLYRPILKMRQQDAGHAIRQARQLSWVDGRNVFLMGLSEGGITTATFQRRDQDESVTARVVEGWTCHAGWKEYTGVRAPASEPVLALVADDDPWFRKPWNRGDCGAFLNKANGSRSVVYRGPRLRQRHELLEDAEVQRTVLAFLRKHARQ